MWTRFVAVLSFRCLLVLPVTHKTTISTTTAFLTCWSWQQMRKYTNWTFIGCTVKKFSCLVGHFSCKWKWNRLTALNSFKSLGILFRIAAFTYSVQTKHWPIKCTKKLNKQRHQTIASRSIDNPIFFNCFYSSALQG